jgi:hypothetical protein
MVGMKDLLAIGIGDGPYDIVDLDRWINAVEKSPRLREVIHENSRPTAIFTSPKGEEKEVYHQHGFIIAVEETKGRDLMEDLARHLNELEGNA